MLSATDAARTALFLPYSFSDVLLLSYACMTFKSDVTITWGSGLITRHFRPSCTRLNKKLPGFVKAGCIPYSLGRRHCGSFGLKLEFNGFTF